MRHRWHSRPWRNHSTTHRRNTTSSTLRLSSPTKSSSTRHLNSRIITRGRTLNRDGNYFISSKKYKTKNSLFFFIDRLLSTSFCPYATKFFTIRQNDVHMLVKS
uniref:Candidate secreted effector n=1 Tax=Meloidogyne incognita TaxID=6306 RepID=A0A914LHQ3_MELIC